MLFTTPKKFPSAKQSLLAKSSQGVTKKGKKTPQDEIERASKGDKGFVIVDGKIIFP